MSLWGSDVAVPVATRNLTLIPTIFPSLVPSPTQSVPGFLFAQAGATRRALNGRTLWKFAFNVYDSLCLFLRGNSFAPSCRFVYLFVNWHSGRAYRSIDCTRYLGGNEEIRSFAASLKSSVNEREVQRRQNLLCLLLSVFLCVCVSEH